jgi:hypothetical protein
VRHAAPRITAGVEGRHRSGTLKAGLSLSPATTSPAYGENRRPEAITVGRVVIDQMLVARRKLEPSGHNRHPTNDRHSAGRSLRLAASPTVLPLTETTAFADTAPRGSFWRKLDIKNPTSCAFGGANLPTLFVTSTRFGLARHETAANPAEGALLALNVGRNCRRALRRLSEPQGVLGL